MRNFQSTFETPKRSFISAFSFCMTVPLKTPLFVLFIKFPTYGHFCILHFGYGHFAPYTQSYLYFALFIEYFPWTVLSVKLSSILDFLIDQRPYFAIFMQNLLIVPSVKIASNSLPYFNLIFLLDLLSKAYFFISLNFTSCQPILFIQNKIVTVHWPIYLEY